jgi:hypothetical protein
MDLTTQETAVALLGRAAGMFRAAMDNGGRLDAAGEFTQWLDDFDAVQPQLGQTAPANESGGA